MASYTSFLYPWKTFTQKKHIILNTIFKAFETALEEKKKVVRGIWIIRISEQIHFSS